MSSEDQQHVALPKLYGAPAYARPSRTVEPSPRPFNPDDLPIAAQQTEEERELVEHLPAATAGAGGLPTGGDEMQAGSEGGEAGRLRLRSFAEKLLGRT